MSNPENTHFICAINIRGIHLPGCHSQVVSILRDPTDFINRIGKTERFQELIDHEWYVRPVCVTRIGSENRVYTDLDSAYNIPLAYTSEEGIIFNQKHPLHDQYILPQTK